MGVEFDTKLSAQREYEKMFRLHAFPGSVIRLLEYLEGNEFKGEQKDIYDFFYCLLVCFWWQVHMLEWTFYAKGEETEDSQLCLGFLASQSAVYIENYYPTLFNSLENMELQNAIDSNLSLNNAGVVFGTFTEYRALLVALLFVTTLHQDIDDATKAVFGKDANLGDIDLHDERLKEWVQKIRKEFLFRLPPPESWPRWKLRVDSESLSCKIGFEFREIHEIFEPNDRTKSSIFRIGTNKLKDEWLTYSKATTILGVDKGTVSRLVRDGKLVHNGKKGKNKRVSKISVLSLKIRHDHKNSERDLYDLQEYARKIPDKH